MPKQYVKIGLAVVAVTLMATLSSCSGGTSAGSKAEAKSSTEGTLTWYTDRDAQEAQPLIDEFTKTTGIKVVPFATNTSALISKTLSESASGTHIADVLDFAGDINLQKLEDADDLAKIPKSVTSTLPKQKAVFTSKDGYWFSNSATLIGIVYNTDKVDKSHAPTDFRSLLDPYWKGKFSIPISTNSTSIQDYYQMSQAPGLGKDFLTALGNNKPEISAQSGSQVSDVIVGNVLAAITDDNAAWEQIQQGAPLKYVYPPKGMAAVKTNVVLLKGAPHPKAAEEFLKFLASKKAQVLLSQTGSISTLPGIPSVPPERPSISKGTYFPNPDTKTLIAAQPTMAPFLKSAFHE